jgi:hypothetical protein
MIRMNKTIIETFCDVCGDIMLYDEKPCCNCNKNFLCDKHSYPEDDAGENTSYYCPDCYKKYRVLKDVVKPEFDNFYEKITELIMGETKW